MMNLSKAKGARKCQLCDTSIKKGEFCYSTTVGSSYGRIGIHIHASHTKKINPKKCKLRTTCVVGEFDCKNVLCKNSSAWESRRDYAED